jgi:hypothetical protein
VGEIEREVTLQTPVIPLLYTLHAQRQPPTVVTKLTSAQKVRSGRTGSSMMADDTIKPVLELTLLSLKPPF